MNNAWNIHAIASSARVTKNKSSALRSAASAALSVAEPPAVAMVVIVEVDGDAAVIGTAIADVAWVIIDTALEASDTRDRATGLAE
jgi:hypothetical protein